MKHEKTKDEKEKKYHRKQKVNKIVNVSLRLLIRRCTDIPSAAGALNAAID